MDYSKSLDNNLDTPIERETHTMFYSDLIFPIGSAVIILIFIFLLYEICTCLICKRSEDEDTDGAVLTDPARDPSCSSRRRQRRRPNSNRSVVTVSQNPPHERTRIVMPMLAQTSTGQIVLLHQVDGAENYRILDEYYAASGNAIYRPTSYQNQNVNRNQLLATHQQLYTWDSQAGLGSSAHASTQQTPTAPPPPYAE